MYKKILVPLDGSELAECVLPYVESIVGGCNVTDVILMMVMEPARVDDGGYYFDVNLSKDDASHINTRNRTYAKSYLQKVAGKAIFGNANVKSEVKTGKPADVISSYVSEKNIDLVVIATHGRSGVSRWAWGSVADKILRSVCSPVMMVRAPGCVPGI